LISLVIETIVCNVYLVPVNKINRN